MNHEILDIFISHSHKDQEKAQELAKNLESWNMRVYVDFKDPVLTQIPNTAIATRLVKNIRLCHIFIFAFSEEAAESKWMPWELGLAHAAIGRVFLWPFTEKALHAKQAQEYLNLYTVLTPENAKCHLDNILEEAKRSSFNPAQIEGMEYLAANTDANLEKFNNPLVASEFMINGPLQLYLAWIKSFNKK